MRNPFSYRCLILVMGLPWTGFPVLGQGSLPPMTEKIFVQTDRTFYLAGERIWFSIFDLDSQYTAPLSISRVAYLEILDSAHHPLIQTKVALNGGRGNGSLLLPLTLRSGNYLLRCYTAWMKNFPPEDYFSQLLTLVNSTHPGDVRPPEGSRTEGILFVPEGGHLVAGIPARVDFFVSGQDGAMTTGTGVIEGPRGDTVESFQWGREGRGSFVFTPVETGGYKALIQIREGDTMVRALPPVADSGMTLRLDRASLDSLQITVYGTAPGLATLELSLEGKTLWSGSQTIQDHQAEFSVAIARFPPGFYRATVFGPDRQELASTSFFHPSARRLEVHAAADQPSYGNRRKVTITLDTEDPSGTGVSADLSVSVFRIDSLPAFPQTGILNALWMTGRGNYPLGADPDSFPEAMDGRVLPVFQRPETYVPEIHGHIITGKVTDVRTGKAAPGVLAYLSVPGKRIQMEASLSDDSGMVHFDLRDFYGPGEIVAETNFVSDSNYRVEIFSPFSESYDPVHIPRLDLSPEFGPALAERGLSMQVENGYHKDPKQISPHLDTAAFFGKPYKTYMLDDYTRFTTMEEVLREYVSEVG
ncbi:MAG TPA: hypothetical protein VMV20_04480, partial [Chitinophagaceae bacterium]|nr:hypothetical protein [Chitinophagaceae bacterium]